MRTPLMFLVLVPLVAGVLWWRTTDDRSTPEARGKYLVEAFGCADCHTPFRMGSQGPEPDPTLFLAGHPQAFPIAKAPATNEVPWIIAATGTNTAWAGPWGVSFSANLTSDAETGLGRWSESMFVEAMRGGRHLGSGRPILPPMPAAALGKMTDADLRAVFAYLTTVPAIRNRVPEPLPPAERP